MPHVPCTGGVGYDEPLLLPNGVLKCVAVIVVDLVKIKRPQVVRGKLRLLGVLDVDLIFHLVACCKVMCLPRKPLLLTILNQFLPMRK